MQEDPEELAKLSITDEAPNVSMFKLRKDLCTPAPQDGQLLNIRTMNGSVRQKRRQILQPSASQSVETFPFVLEGGRQGKESAGASVADRSGGSLSVPVTHLAAPGRAPGSISGSALLGGLPSAHNYLSVNSALALAGAQSVDSVSSPLSQFSPELQTKIKLRKYKMGLSPLTKVKRLQRELEARSDLFEYMAAMPMNDDDDQRSECSGSPSMASTTHGGKANNGKFSPGAGVPPPPASMDLSDLDSTDSRRPLSSMRRLSKVPTSSFDVEVSNSPKPKPKKSALEDTTDTSKFDIKAEMDKLHDPRFKKLYSKDESKTVDVNPHGSLSKQIHQLYLVTPTPLSAHQPIEEEEPLYNPEKFRIPIIQERRPGEKETIFNSAALREATFRSRSRTGSRSGSRASSRAVSRAGSSTDLFGNSRKQQQSRSLSEYHAKLAREREESEQAWTAAGGLSAAEYLAMSRDEIRSRASTASMVRGEYEPCLPRRSDSFRDMFAEQGPSRIRGASSSSLCDSIDSMQSQSQPRGVAPEGGLMVGGQALEGSSGSGTRGMSDSVSLTVASGNHCPRKRTPVLIDNGGLPTKGHTCRHCLRRALLWCDDCKTPYCYGCWGKVPHHDFADSNALKIKTIEPVHLQYKDNHFEPMCMDSRGHLVTSAEEEAARARAKQELTDEFSDINMGSFSVASRQQSANNVVGDSDYGFADPTRRADRDKVRNGPRRAAKIAPGSAPGSQLTPSMVAMLSDDFRDRHGPGGVLHGGSLASSLTGVDSVGSLASKEAQQLANQYMPVSSICGRAPGEYGATLPRSRGASRGEDGSMSRLGSRSASRGGSTDVSRAQSQAVLFEDLPDLADAPAHEGGGRDEPRPEFEVNNHTSPTQAPGSATLSDSGLYLPSGARTVSAARAHQHSRSRIRHPHDHHEIHISPIRPSHTIQQDATAGGASLAASRKHKEPLLFPAAGETEHAPGEGDHHHHEHHLEDYRMQLHPTEFKLGLPHSQTQGDQSTYVPGPVSQHIVEAEERLKAAREHKDRTVTISGKAVRVQKPTHHAHAHADADKQGNGDEEAAAGEAGGERAASPGADVLTDSPGFSRPGTSPSPSRPKTGDGDHVRSGRSSLQGSRPVSPSQVIGRGSPGMDDENI